MPAAKIKITKPPVVPTDTLDSFERARWHEIIDNHPADFFDQYHAPLITEYVKALSLAHKFGLYLDPLISDPDTIAKLFGLKKQAITAAAMLATRLRLTVQASTELKVTANAKKQNAAAARRPWDYNA